MGVSGSAKNEYAARFGAVSGTYAKRLMIIMWAFVGLIGCGLYFGDQRLAEPDMLWGRLSRQLLAPGLFGLMLAGLLAAMMSNIGTNAMASSALFVRNVYTYIAPGRSDKTGVKVGRLTIVVVLVVGMFVALTMNDVVSFIRVMLTVNAPWGAAIVLMFFWRRLTRAAVWWCIVLSAGLFVVLPFIIQLSHTLSTDPALIAFTQPAKVAPVPMYFDHVVHQDPFDLSSPLVGGGRFNLEAWLLSKAGLDLAAMSGRDLQSVQFFFAAIFPFVVLVVASLLTRPPAREKTDWFFGKMKTPVGATPELEAASIEETRNNPRRFDHTKLFPSSNWEWTRWDKTDTVGFVICLGVSAGIIFIFWFLLRLVAGA
jgi:Na+/proline symporter